MAERKIKMLKIDLLPDLSLERVTEKLSNDRGRNTVSNFLRKVLKLPPVKLALLNEFCNHSHFDKTELAYKIKNLTIIIDKNYPMDQAISTSGGISKYSFDKDLMLKDLPGVFCAGEMLDWTAPTGGFLLTGCLSSGAFVGQSVVRKLNLKRKY